MDNNNFDKLNDTLKEDDIDYENMDIEELKKQIEKEKLIAELKALKQKNKIIEEVDDLEPNTKKIPGTSIVITHDINNDALSPRERKKYNKKNGIACCPKCGSTSIQAGNKKLSIGRAVVGGALLGPLGAGVGALTSKQTVCTCLHCGHKWKLK